MTGSIGTNATSVHFHRQNTSRHTFYQPHHNFLARTYFWCTKTIPSMLYRIAQAGWTQWNVLDNNQLTKGGGRIGSGGGAWGNEAGCPGGGPLPESGADCKEQKERKSISARRKQTSIYSCSEGDAWCGSQRPRRPVPPSFIFQETDQHYKLEVPRSHQRFPVGPLMPSISFFPS